MYIFLMLTNPVSKPDEKDTRVPPKARVCNLLSAMHCFSNLDSLIRMLRNDFDIEITNYIKTQISKYYFKKPVIIVMYASKCI